MRIFEIILTVVNLLTLLLSFKRQAKTLWLGITGVNLAVLLLHGLSEGFRYQMTFAYLLVVYAAVMAVYTLAASGNFFKVSIPKALKAVVISLACILLALTSFVAYALPVFMLPKPTGDYAIGIQYVALVDDKRNDPFLDQLTQKRKLMVKIYYPAKPEAEKTFSSYFHSPEFIRAFMAGYNLPAFMFEHLNLVKTHSKDALEVSDAQPNYPVVLFSHGAGTSMEVATSQSEDLASHGYIVVAIDHTYVSWASAFPDHVVTAHEATTNFDTPEPADPITQIMADDAIFVIDQLGEMNEGGIVPAFKGKLNLNEIGVIGHSVGGAVAYNLASNDSRIKAAINLDGVVFITPKNPKAMAPFLMLANDQYHVQAIEKRESLIEKFAPTLEGQQTMLDIYGGKEGYDKAYNQAQQNITGLANLLKTSGNLYTIDGSDHMKFTDIGLFIGSRWLRELVNIRGQTDPARCLEITEALTLAFFDHHLKGKNTEVLQSLLITYPELRKVNLN